MDHKCITERELLEHIKLMLERGYGSSTFLSKMASGCSKCPKILIVLLQEHFLQLDGAVKEVGKEHLGSQKVNFSMN